MLADCLGGVVTRQLVRTADGIGRLVAYEILVGSAEAAALVRENKMSLLSNVMETGQSHGMQTLDLTLGRMLSQQQISAEDALDRAVDREALARVVARIRPDLAERMD